MNKDYKLDFNCPIDIDSMPRCSKGFNCTMCEKIVVDYSKMDLKTFDSEIERNSHVSNCGKYKKYQLVNSFDDWRDSVSRIYRHLIRKSHKQKLYKFYLPFISIFFFLVSCGGGRHMAGAYAKSDLSKKNDHIKKIELNKNSQKTIDLLPGKKW